MQRMVVVAELHPTLNKGSVACQLAQVCLGIHKLATACVQPAPPLNSLGYCCSFGLLAGFLAGLAITIHVAVTMPMAAGQQPWGTLHLGVCLVLIPAACAVGLGLITLWVSLAVHQVKRAAGGAGSAPRMATWGPAAAVAANMGRASQLVPAEGAVGAGKAGAGSGAGCILQVPRPSGESETFAVTMTRPDVAGVIQGWLGTLQQLPAAVKGQESEGKASSKLHCLVYGCGPTPLDHATQIAVAKAGAQHKAAGRGAVQLEFVRKAQML
jgi:hypothetical protein